MAPVSSHPENSQLRAPCVLKPLRGLFALVVFVLGAAVALAQSDLATLRAQAEAGDPVALNALGNLYANGQGVTRDDAEALRQYTLSAERSYAPANFNLGMMYELGSGVSTDITRAFSYYLKAAQQGFAPAQYNVGNMYAGGLGVGQDNFEAVLWFTQAADQGVAEAQYNLGLAYELGRGVSADAIQAQRWYGLSAEQGYARANYNLDVMKEEGRGSAKDEAGAAEFYLAAAQLGFGPAQNNYGIMLAEGRGGEGRAQSQSYRGTGLAECRGRKRHQSAWARLGRQAIVLFSVGSSECPFGIYAQWRTRHSPVRPGTGPGCCRDGCGRTTA